jgi:hypothetical protein
MPCDSVQERTIPAARQTITSLPGPASRSLHRSEADMRRQWRAVPDFPVRSIRPVIPGRRPRRTRNPDDLILLHRRLDSAFALTRAPE